MFNQCHQRSKCSAHIKSFLGKRSVQYIGPFIPFDISRPIRAGLLYGVNEDELRSLVVNLLGPSYPVTDEYYTQRREEHARMCIAVVSGFNVPELADNCFWGVSFEITKKKLRSKTGRDDQGIHHVIILNKMFKFYSYSHRFRRRSTIRITIQTSFSRYIIIDIHPCIPK